jgi:hypothetical protein
LEFPAAQFRLALAKKPQSATNPDSKKNQLTAMAAWSQLTTLAKEKLAKSRCALIAAPKETGGRKRLGPEHVRRS